MSSYSFSRTSNRAGLGFRLILFFLSSIVRRFDYSFLTVNSVLDSSLCGNLSSSSESLLEIDPEDDDELSIPLCLLDIVMVLLIKLLSMPKFALL